jgi:hypothetical protein
MGYVPLFDSLTTGTLCGKWPDIGLWPVLLSMANRFGDIDVTPSYIANVTGLDEATIEECIARFCAPDANSRTIEDEGRRLVPIDTRRSWGWHVINHTKYREKARKLSFDSARTASGMDAKRKRTQRANSKRPALSRDIPPSDGNEDGDVNKSALLPINTKDSYSYTAVDNFSGQERLKNRLREKTKPLVAKLTARP